jgi:hypothetical protein
VHGDDETKSAVRVLTYYDLFVVVVDEGNG